MRGLGQHAVGISIEESAIRCVSLKKHKTWEVRKKKALPLQPGMIVENQIADGESLLDILKPWVKKQGLRGVKVSLAIPPAQIIIRKMSIPSTNEKQLEQLVKLEVETGLHLPFENPVYDYVTTSADENQSHLLVFAAPRKPIQDYIDTLEAAGLRVGSIEISATALARSIMLSQGEAFTETMLIHLEQSLMDIYMFREGNPVFIRTINVADLQAGRTEPAVIPVQGEMEYRLEAAATHESAEEHLSPEQMLEITAEISRMLNFYQYSLHDGSTRISNILITGTPGIRGQLYEELSQSLAEQEIIPLSLDQLEAAAAGSQNQQLNSYRIATGAALGCGGKHINLLPREDREAMLFPYLAIALVGIWLLGIVGTGILYAANKGQIRDQSELIQGLQDRNAMLQLELAKANTGGSGKLDRSAAVDEILKYKQELVPILNELASGLPKGASFNGVGYTFHNAIDLTVKLPRMEDAAEYLAELRKMSFTVDVFIQKLSEGDMAGNTQSPATLTRFYTAVYHVNLARDVQQDAEVSNLGEADESGTNQ
ncbi:pilus assembly protein PilM [Paenibacillus tritici]|uniref:pilus assembly protein PilM n=1 Tax=Paenibacillus tritici TaxID=1873425 RepID=UPI001BA44DDB|nr:pilus assembly protein PilM [Paenibacillus tritici]QUL54522.1 pilus assembly protein PilM [Paenibacillus tritici]